MSDTLPHNLAIEQVILSSILNNNSVYDNISDILNEFDFFEVSHQIIYKNIIEKLEKGQVADTLTLMNALSNSGITPEYLLSLSETSYPPENIRQYSNLLVELSLRRKIIQLGKKIAEDASEPEKKIETQLSYAEKVVFELAEKRGNEGCVKFCTSASELMKTTKNLLGNDRSVTGITTGFNCLNEVLGGFQKGQLIILAGRPSVGKTAFALNMAVSVALSKKEGGPVLFVSLEMPHDQICARIVSSISNVPLGNILYAKMSQSMFRDCVEAVQKFQELPFYVYDYPHVTTGTFLSLLRQVKRQYGVSLAIIDYLQLIDSGGKQESREQELSRISRMLKLIAKEIKIPILVLSQMSRDIEKRKDSPLPRLSDLRGSGAIEQDADIVMFLSQKETQVVLTVAKNRNGPLGNYTFDYDGPHTLFKETT